MEFLPRDIRYASRVLAGNPGFTAVAVLALALGIGANTAIFSVLNAVLLRPLPFPEPDRLVQIWGSSPSKNIPFHNVTYSDVSDWRKQSQSYEQMTGYAPGTINLSLGDEPERLNLARVNASFFPMLGARFVQGRAFLPEEDKPGAPRVAIMSHELWKRRFGADPRIVGDSMILDGNGYSVTGILPQGFALPGRTVDLYIPLALNDAREQSNDVVTVTVFARLKPGVSLKQAQAEMDTIGRRLAQFPRSQGTTPRIWGLREFVVRDVKLSLIVLLAAVGLVLLIACANVANLLLARAGMRQTELAVRAALGASRGRILQQLLTESALLGLAGGAIGILLAYWGVRILLRITPDRYPLLKGAAIDLPVLAFTLLISTVTALIFGLVPALILSRASALTNALKEGGRGSGEVFSRSRLRSILVIAEVALALLLLIGTGLMVRSFMRLNSVDPGFNGKGVLTASISLPGSRYQNPGQRIAFFRQLFEKLSSMPEVTACGAVSSLPLSQHNTGTGMCVEGRPFPLPGEVPIIWFRIANSDYFRAMEIPLRRGRLFTDQDQAGLPVAVINETAARRYWPNEDPIGKRFTNGPPRPGTTIQWITVVGIVADLRHMSLTQAPDAELFWPYQQLAPASLTLTIRTRSDAAHFAPSLRRMTAAVDKDQPVSQIRSMEQYLFDSIAPQRLSVTLLGIFAGIALVLAVIGIYGVISFSVARRTREIGVRMALGASGGTVVRMIVRQALLLVLSGVAIGIAAALALTRFISSLLFGVSATDPAVLAGVTVLLIAIASLACYIPARRASAVDPIVALRYE
jgi:predicted permease